MNRDLRIGVIAAEFPPEVGGMQSMALHLAIEMSKSHNILVCTTRKLQRNTYAFPLLANLHGRTEADVPVLNGVDVDVWLAMNAGYAAIAKKLSKPVVAYFHGNDFLKPFVVSTPLLAKVLSKLPLTKESWSEKRREYARRQIGVGITSLRILTNSSHTKRLIHEHYPHAREVFVCHPGVEEKFFQNVAGRDADPVPLRLLTVSRLEKATRRKNVAGVLQALALLKEKLSFRYSIVGDGDDAQNLIEMTADLGLSDYVTFCGRVSDSDLLRLYREADLFVLPVKASTTDVEGFGIVYLEANAAGLPVLCSAAGGATDAVVDRETGIILPGSESHQIAEGILQFVYTREAYKPERLREFAAGFTWKLAAARIESHIGNAVESFAAKAPSNSLAHENFRLTRSAKA